MNFRRTLAVVYDNFDLFIDEPYCELNILKTLLTIKSKFNCPYLDGEHVIHYYFGKILKLVNTLYKINDLVRLHMHNNISADQVTSLILSMTQNKNYEQYFNIRQFILKCIDNYIIDELYCHEDMSDIFDISIHVDNNVINNNNNDDESIIYKCEQCKHSEKIYCLCPPVHLI